MLCTDVYSCILAHRWLQYSRSSVFFTDSGVTLVLLCSLGKNLVSSTQSILWSQFSTQVLSMFPNSFRPSTRSSGVESLQQYRRESETLMPVELFLIHASASKFRYPVTFVIHVCALPVWRLVKLKVCRVHACYQVLIYFSLLMIIMKQLLSEVKHFLAKLVFVLLDIVQT